MMYLAFMICLSATLTLGNETQNTKIVKKIAMKITMKLRSIKSVSS